MVDAVLVADDPVAQAAAQPPEVTALLQQVLASNQVIVASNQAIAARITALEIAQGKPHLQGMQHLPMAAQPAGVALGAGQLLPWGAGALAVQPVSGASRTQPGGRRQRGHQRQGQRSAGGRVVAVPGWHQILSGARELQRGGGAVARPSTPHTQEDYCWRLRGPVSYTHLTLPTKA